MSSEEQASAYESWSLLELMGHRRLGGFVREVQIAGAGFFRIDLPGDTEGETHSTQFYPPSSVYCLTPVSEAAARAIARSSRPQPVATWELPEPSPRRWPICSNCEERHQPGPCAEVDDEDEDYEGRPVQRVDEMANIPF